MDEIGVDDKYYYLEPDVISYTLSIGYLTEEQEAYIRQIYKDFKRQPIDPYNNCQYEIFAKADDGYFNKDFEKVLIYLQQQGFEKEGGCNYCD